METSICLYRESSTKNIVELLYLAKHYSTFEDFIVYKSGGIIWTISFIQFEIRFEKLTKQEVIDYYKNISKAL